MKKTWKSNNPPKYLGEKNSGEKHTVPDQTLSIREILNRYAKGQPVAQVQREPIYNEDIEFNNPLEYDLTEIDVLKDMYKNSQEDSKKLLAEQQARLKELENPPPKPDKPEE